jgi:hypothetical protein
MVFLSANRRKSVSGNEKMELMVGEPFVPIAKPHFRGVKEVNPMEFEEKPEPRPYE